MSRWHLWLGSEVKRPRCEVCGTRWLVFRYTNGELDVRICLRHRNVIPGGQRGERGTVPGVRRSG